MTVIKEMVLKRKVPFDYMKWLGKSFMEKLHPLHTILPYHSSPRKKRAKNAINLPHILAGSKACVIKMINDCP